MNDPARSIPEDAGTPLADLAQPDAAPHGPGTMLGEERRRQGMSLGDIARQLKLSVRQIEALERDDYGVFSGMVFVRGFLRNYAKLLQLDPDALIAQLPGVTAPAAVGGEVAPIAPGDAEAHAPRTDGRPGLGWLAGGLVLAMLVVAAVYEGRRHQSTAQAPQSSQAPAGGAVNPQHADSPPAGLATPGAPAAAAPAGPVDLARSATPAPPTAAAPGGPSASPIPAAPPPGTPSADAPAAAARPAATASAQTPAAAPGGTPQAHPAPAPAAAAGPATPQAAAPSAGVPPIAPGAAGELLLKFQAEAWVEVKDGSGEVLFSRLGSAGTEQALRGRPPLRVVVGNAHAVQVTYKGRLVDLGPHTRVDVARLVLD
jgi:cytoskeleton protein RodZ